ncbi:MAG TPA: ADYC domain-containing protein [Nannocystis sp.]
MNKHTITAFTLTAALAMTACTEQDVTQEADDELDPRGAVYSCPAWKCGFNAAEVNGRSLQELNLDGLPNADGARIVGIVPPPLTLLGGYKLDVDNDELVLRKGNSVLRGSQLVGTILLVQLPIGLPVPVTILDYTTVPSWAEGQPPIAAYTLVYPEPMELLGVKNVCTGSLLDPLASVATVLGGERYDEASKTVLPNQSRWFTLACAGSAAAKLKLLGYGPQSSATTPAQRQATLKMITADYCGGGESYTENGTEVQWINRSGAVGPSEGELGAVEAIWDEHGALCLEATRLPGVEVGCALPTCSDFTVDDGEWITHVPPP